MSDYADILAQINEALESFVALLGRESELLDDHPVDIETLLNVCERKGTATMRLDQLDRARRAVLEQQGFTPDRTGSDLYAREHDLDDSWQRLIELTETASQRNRLNGFTIERRLDFHNRALEFLQNAAGMTMYGPNGRQRNLRGSSTYLCG
ncbi:flagella synthesis protein FlgN [Kushneria aurantia]|uniref:Flagella synthesis protein FlgN n=1 Tax=Kushneria aurantia TaxID=504092 RepID=A0ABV6G169_9GAMM|nr:flagellar protein FlgN [Kushneria aurantia]